MKIIFKFLLLACILSFAGSAFAGEATMKGEIEQLKQRVDKLEQKSSMLDKIGLGGTVAGAYQYQRSNADGVDDFGRGAVVFQPEISIRPTENDEVFFKLGFGAGNGLNNDKYAFVLAPWAADLEDDVKDINGRNRDYLFNVWGKHRFSFGSDQSLSITGGIIDSTDYLDENAYANDEFTQFMNEAFVNSPIALLPSYDIGGALEWKCGGFSAKAVFMGVGENEEGNPYNFYGVQFAYGVETCVGRGIYRVAMDETTKDFTKPSGGRARLQGVTVSCDQELGEILGAWIRVGWQADDALVDFDELYSGGINISGKLWGRGQDNIGVGYAYLDGANSDLDKSQVAEGYVRFGLSEVYALTLDVQYLKDDYKSNSGQDDVDGWVTGVRMTMNF